MSRLWEVDPTHRRLTPAELQKHRVEVRRSVLTSFSQFTKSRRRDKLKQLRAVTDDEWFRAQSVYVVEAPVLPSQRYGTGAGPGTEASSHALSEAKLDPELWIRQMSTIQMFIYYIMRAHEVDVALAALEVLRNRIRVYEDEMTYQAVNVGCPGLQARLRNEVIHLEFREKAKEDAMSIANTYNYDVARAIVAIGVEMPTANRYVYASRLRKYLEVREAWKDPQVAQYTDNWAKAKAQHDFYVVNRLQLGYAVLVPVVAVCPICKAMIARGRVSLAVASNTRIPFHVNCPHVWNFYPQRVLRDRCPYLWLGE